MSETNTKHIVVEAVSTKNLGIKEEGGNWYNYAGVEQEKMRTAMNTLKKGSGIDLEMIDDKSFKTYTLVDEPSGNTSSGKGNWADEYVNYEQLVDLLTERTGGRFNITVTLVEFDMEAEWAVAKCEITANFPPAELPEGTEENTLDAHKLVVNRTCSDYGDATQKNCASLTKDAFIRMASTRAKVRALRNILGIGATAIEEINMEKKE